MFQKHKSVIKPHSLYSNSIKVSSPQFSANFHSENHIDTIKGKIIPSKIDENTQVVDKYFSTKYAEMPYDYNSYNSNKPTSNNYLSNTMKTPIVKGIITKNSLMLNNDKVQMISNPFSKSVNNYPNSDKNTLTKSLTNSCTGNIYKRNKIITTHSKPNFNQEEDFYEVIADNEESYNPKTYNTRSKNYNCNNVNNINNINNCVNNLNGINFNNYNIGINNNNYIFDTNTNKAFITYSIPFRSTHRPIKVNMIEHKGRLKNINYNEIDDGNLNSLEEDNISEKENRNEKNRFENDKIFQKNKFHAETEFLGELGDDSNNENNFRKICRKDLEIELYNKNINKQASDYNITYGTKIDTNLIDKEETENMSDVYESQTYNNKGKVNKNNNVFYKSATKFRSLNKDKIGTNINNGIYVKKNLGLSSSKNKVYSSRSNSQEPGKYFSPNSIYDKAKRKISYSKNENDDKNVNMFDNMKNKITNILEIYASMIDKVLNKKYE